MKKFLVVLLILLIGAGFYFFNYYYSRGNGVKSGVLIQFQQEGTVFKTYEGEIASASLRNMSNKSFKFSVTNQAIADQLMKLTDKELSLHFEKYKGALPWRGANYLQSSQENGSNEPCAQYIVDKIESVNDKQSNENNLPLPQEQQPQQAQPTTH